MNIFIVGSGNVDSGDLFREKALESKLMICVDGGARHFMDAGITPHILIGDFDSIAPDIFEAYKNLGVNILKYPAKKNYTDMELALDYALELGATRVFMMGATGTRLDHTISNLQLLYKLLDSDVEGIILNQKNTVYLIKKSIELEKKDGYRVSLLPATQVVEGITTKGLAYPLTDATMAMGTGLGISNEFISEKAAISIRTGRLFVIISKD